MVADVAVAADVTQAALDVDRILHGDALETLRTLPSESIHCVITSPPYWGQRDYGVRGQLGLEQTPAEYIANMVAVFAEVRRVLRKDGVAWVNMGDAYANNASTSKIPRVEQGNGTGVFRIPGEEHVQARRQQPNRLTPMKHSGLKHKDLVGVPWMLALALRDDGWYLRSDVIWHKPNAMPESVRDRPSMDHEHIFLLARSARYYYDADAIREPHRSLNRPPGNKSRAFLDRDPHHHTGEKRRPGQEQSYHAAGRNKRTVWTIATKPYKGAHFATFPPALVEPCLLAGTSPRVCERCGAPWRRQVARDHQFAGGSGRAGRTPEDIAGTGKRGDAGRLVGKHLRLGPVITVATLGWQPTCRHHDAMGSAHAIVLDPFFGAGTVGVVARRHQRHYLGIDLNAEYIAQAEARIAAERQPVLWSASA